MRAFRDFFYGNWFYGICAVALTIEAALQQEIPVPAFPYMLMLAVGTVLFYTHAYRQGSGSDERSIWYGRHHDAIGYRQILLAGVLAMAFVIGLVRNVIAWQDLPLLAIFPLIAGAYYGSGRWSLRRSGLVKPFIIGLVWAGVVTWHPVVLHAGMDGLLCDDRSLRLFLKNLLFILLLCILFDIKDQADDHRHALRTVVVERGLRSTLFHVVVPLCVLGCVAFLVLAFSQAFSWQRVLLNIVPFVAFISVALALRRKRSLMFYLVVVDGLMLLKAICGSLAMRWP